MATSLYKSENKILIDYLHPKRFHIVKRLRKSVQYILRYSTEYESYFALSYQKFNSGVTGPKFTKIFTWHSDSIYAVNVHIEVAIFCFVSESQCDKWEEFAIYLQNWLPSQCPLRYRKKRSRSIICTQNAFIWWKDCKNWCSRSWDNCSLSDHYKKKEINASKIYSHYGKFKWATVIH